MNQGARLLKAGKIGFGLLLTTPLTPTASALANNHVLVIHSYHSDLRWTDPIMNGIRDALDRSGFDVQQDAMFIHRPESLYSKHRTLAGATALVFFALSVSVVVLSIATIRRRKAEEALRKANLVVENSPAMLFRWKAAEGWPVALVSENVRQLGYSSEELLNGSIRFASMIHPNDLERVGREIQVHSANRAERFQQEYRMITKEGNVRWVDDRTVVERDAEGQITHYQGVVVDITERKRAEETLRENKAMMESLLAATPVGVGLLKNRVFLQVNKALCAITGYSEEEMVGLKTRVLYPDDEEFDRVGREAYPKMEREGLATLEARLKRKDGAPIDVLLSLAPFDPTDIKAGVTATVLDITDRKRAATELERAHLLLEAILEQSPVPMVVASAPDFVLRYGNRAAVELLGASDEPSYVGLALADSQRRQTWQEVRPDGAPVNPQELPLTRALRGETTRNEEYGIIRKDGTQRWELVNGTPVYNRAGELVAGLIIFPDITERKRAQEALQQSEERFRTLFMSMSEGFYLSEVLYEDQGHPCDYRYLEVNPKFEQMMGLSRDQIVGKRYKELVPVDTSHWLDIYFKVALTGTPRHYEFYSQEYHQHFETFSYRQGKDQVAVFVLNITERKRAEAELARHRDRLEELVRERTAELEKEIAERKQAEEQIQAALAEKEVLLREVHHRVKNNLNTIANILYFQAKTLEDKKALAAFQDSQNRIHSMARVHEHLYRSASLARVNMPAYFEDLAADMQQTSATCLVSIRIDAAREHLDIDQAIPCGLIVNELATNALKYAFREGRIDQENKVAVRLTTEGDRHILEVCDNGVGLPTGMEVEKSASLGLRLVSMLTRQLKGQLTIQTAPEQGTKFTVSFPLT